MSVRSRWSRQPSVDTSEACQGQPVGLGYFKHDSREYQENLKPYSFIEQIIYEFLRLISNFFILIVILIPFMILRTTDRRFNNVKIASTIPLLPTLKTSSNRFYLIVATITNRLTTIRAVPIGDIDNDRQLSLRLRERYPSSFFWEPRLRMAKFELYSSGTFEVGDDKEGNHLLTHSIQKTPSESYRFPSHSHKSSQAILSRISKITDPLRLGSNRPEHASGLFIEYGIRWARLCTTLLTELCVSTGIILRTKTIENIRYASLYRGSLILLASVFIACLTTLDSVIDIRYSHYSINLEPVILAMHTNLTPQSQSDEFCSVARSDTLPCVSPGPVYPWIINKFDLILKSVSTQTTSQTPTLVKQPTHSKWRDIYSRLLSKSTSQRPNQKGVTWSCGCGKRLHSTCQRDTATRIRLQRQLDNYFISSESITTRDGTWYKRPDAQFLPRAISSGFHTLLGAIIGKKPQELPSHNRLATRSVSAVSSEALESTAKPLFLLLCVPSTGRCKTLLQVPVHDIHKDRDLFLRLQTLLAEQLNLWSSWRFLWAPISVEFVQITLMAGLCDKSKAGTSQHANCKLACRCMPQKDHPDYHYTRDPDRRFPPIPSELLLECLCHPDLIREEQTWVYDCLPKKMRGKLKAHDKEKIVGWGLSFNEDLDWSCIWTLFLTILAICVVVALIVSAVTGDWSTPWTVAAVVVGALTCLLGMLSTRRDKP